MSALLVRTLILRFFAMSWDKIKHTMCTLEKRRGQPL
jgi:hypothetical protein